MKVIKPQRIGLLQRVVEHDRRCTLVVSVMVYVPLGAPRNLLTEVSLWKDLAPELPTGVLDEGLPKPRGEVLVTCRASAPGGEPATAVMTRLQVGAVDKKLAVMGDRFWKNGEPSEPVPFREMPIDYAHAFGGEGYEQNPTGKGFVPLETEHGEVLPLPNVEDPDALITSRQDRPAPAGFGPYDLTWPQRFDKVGRKYDAKWLETRFPGPAEDFDAQFYNTAPTDQQLEGFFEGDESIVLEGMHPTEPRLAGQLEPLVVRFFATQREGDGEEVFKAMGTRLETVHFFPHLERAVLIYRGTLEVAEDDADDIVHLIVAAEDPAHPKPVEHYQQVLALRLDKDKGALASLKDQDLMPPEEEGWSARIDTGDVGEMVKLEQLSLENMERGRERKLAEAREKMVAAGFAPDEHAEDIPEIEPPPDPDDVDGLMAYVDKMQARSVEMQADMEKKKVEMEEQARASFADAGFDYEAEQAKAMAQAGGPPDFSADEHLVMLHDMARIARDGGQPLEDLEQDLTDPRYEQMLQQLEVQVRDGYVRSAHYLPAAAALGDEERAMVRVKVTAAKDGGESLAGCNLTRADLSGLDLQGMDLSKALLEGADLSGANLADADLSGAVVAHADLTDTNLSGAKLCGTNLGAATLKNTDLSDAKLEQAILARAVIDGAMLLGAELEDVDFLETKFVQADLSHAIAKTPLFLQVDLKNVGFTGAQLAGARFIEADIEGVDFTGCELTGAQFIQTRGDGASFAGATLDGAVFVHESSFARCSFAGARLARANFRKTPLTAGNFERAEISEADFSGCDLTGAVLHQVKGRAARMTRTDLTGANLRGADLLEGMLSKATLHGADLTGANLSRADLSRILVDGDTTIDDALMLDTRVEPKHDDQPR